MKLHKERELLVQYGRKLLESGLTRGTGGNLSVFDRTEGLIAVTPSGLDYLKTAAEDIILLDLQGNVMEAREGRKPTSEVSLHLAIYRSRPDVSAIVHTHSLHATALACMGEEIRAVHYLAALGGRRVRCAPYHTYGSGELAKACLHHLEGNFAVLLANHGLVTVGDSLPGAFSTAEHLEYVAEIQCLTQGLGGARELTADEMEAVMARLEVFPYS